MSTRERWIVYPLIFLTLGIALRDKLTYRVRTNEIEAQRVVCNQLVAKHQIDCQTMVVHSPKGNPVAVIGTDAATQGGLIETFSSQGVPQVRIQSTEGSGVVTAIDQAGKTVTLGCINKTPGVFAFLPDQKLLVPLTLKVEFKPNANAPQPNAPEDSKKPVEPPKNSPPKKTAAGA